MAYEFLYNNVTKITCSLLPIVIVATFVSSNKFITKNKFNNLSNNTNYIL